MIVLAAGLVLLGVYLTAYVLYQSVLFVANSLIADAVAASPAKNRRFVVLIPVHNEELYLPRLLESLEAQEYPKERYRVTVVADNCTDGTVGACRPYDVDVLERHDTTKRGKGHALRWAIERLDLDRFDAVVILDGDSLVNPEFLKHFNVQIEGGDRVIQSSNAVANPEQSWFTRLMDISENISNEIVFPGKRKLGLSSYLLGNGMCFVTEIIKTYGWDAFSVGEDWEYYAKLILRNEYVGFSRLSRQYHEESVNLTQASSQRIRWSGGRFQVLRQYGPALISKGLRTRDLRCLDACLPLVFPNVSLGVNMTIAGLVLAGAYTMATGSMAFVLWYAGLFVLQGILFAIGIFHTKNKLANGIALLLAPVFLAWKLCIDVVSFAGVGTKEWKRTERRLQ